MGKLRDWWPSEEMLEQSRSSSSNNAAGTTVGGSGPAAAEANGACAAIATAHALAAEPTSAAVTLRLSEVAAALNAMPNFPPSSVANHPPCPSSVANSTPNEVGGSNSSPFPKPTIRLTNTQAHKDELLKKLLSRSESSTDLRMCLSTQKAHPLSLPSSPVHSNASPVLTSNSQQPWKSFTTVIERGMQRKSEASKPSMDVLASEDSVDLRKRKRDTSLSLKSSTVATSPDTEDNVQTPATPSTTPEPLGTLKETLTRREIHIFSERQRRKGMTHLYTILHSLLPDAKPKTDRCTVLTEAMDYIQELQVRLKELDTQKSEILASIREQLQMETSTMTGSLMQGGAEDAVLGRHMGNMDDLITEEMREEILAAADVVVRFCGRDVFITLNSPRRNGVWSAILHVLHEKDMDLLNVTLSTSNDMDYHCIHAKVSNSELHSNELQQMLQEVVLNHAVLD